MVGKKIKKGMKNEIKNIVKYTSIIYIVLSLIYLISGTLLQININKSRKNEIIKNEQRLLDTEQNVISYRIGRVASDVLYISDNMKNHYMDDFEFKKIENEWINFSNRKKVYDQIRYIDVEGNEKIRVNYSENGAFAVSEDELQNKEDRYYFNDAIGLGKNQIYISILDLNMENCEIEVPIKPTIRVSTPIFDSENKLKGIVILNYLAENLLSQFEDVGSTRYGNLFLLNSDGYWVYNSENKDKEWTFMYEDKKEINFKNEYPEEWAIIDNNNKGNLDTENGYYEYVNIIPSMDTLEDTMKITNNSIILGQGNWRAVSFISKDRENELVISTSIHNNIIYIFKRHKFSFVFLFIISVILATLAAINKRDKEEIKYFSEYDAMTGTLNRRAGFEILHKVYTEYSRGKGMISICFCDINGLKEVNDNLGHEAGDELILSVVKEIKNNIRYSDFLIRLGGDEFLIIFVNSDIKESENTWDRICDGFERINETEDRQYIISVSHGIDEFNFSTDEYIDEIVSLADEKMYDEKRKIKKDFKIIK